MNSTLKTTTSHALRLLGEMDGYFTSMNSVQPLPAERKSVPVGEWTELRDAVRAALSSAAPQATVAAPAELVALADTYARDFARAHVESLYGTSKSYTAECHRDSDEARAALVAALAEATVKESLTVQPSQAGDPGLPDFALSLGLQYAKEALSLHDQQFDRHPATEFARQAIQDDISRIEASLHAVPATGVIREVVSNIGERLNALTEDQEETAQAISAELDRLLAIVAAQGGLPPQAGKMVQQPLSKEQVAKLRAATSDTVQSLALFGRGVHMHDQIDMFAHSIQLACADAWGVKLAGRSGGEG